MEQNASDLIAKLIKSVFSSKGETSLDLRKSIQTKIYADVSKGDSESLEDNVLNTYVEKVARNAYKVVDQDITKLKTAGYSEEAIFELTVVTAVAAGNSRLKIGLDLLKSPQS